MNHDERTKHYFKKTSLFEKHNQMQFIKMKIIGFEKNWRHVFLFPSVLWTKYSEKTSF